MVLHSTRKWKPVIGPAKEHWQDEMSLTLKRMSLCVMELRSGPYEFSAMDVLSLQYLQGQWLKAYLLLIFFLSFVSVTST